MYQPTKIRSAPGVKRDGTVLEGATYVDGLWCRFQRGLPKKVGGFVSVAQNLPERVYGIHSFSANSRQHIHLGGAAQLQKREINNSGQVVGQNDRTPAGLVASDLNLWQFDAIFDVATGETVLVAHAAPNQDLDSTEDRAIFFGPITGGAILTPSAQDQVSGGVVVVGNYLVAYGSEGHVQWSEENNITVATRDALPVTQQKIVVGRRIRGSGPPAALLWSLDSLILMSLGDPTDVAWVFTTLTDETSILSSRGVVEYDGIYYWAGVDRFLMFNGAVLEVPNSYNSEFFFDNLNFSQRQKIFALKVPRYGEIWWCFPLGSSIECNHAVIYNVREQIWYDTPLPDPGRTAGLYAKVYNRPFMTGVRETFEGYDLWQHETGVDETRVSKTNPVPSHFETHEISMPVGQGRDKALSVCVIEPDFVQKGLLQVRVRGRANSRAPFTEGEEHIIPQAATTPDDQIVRLKEHRRLMSFKFSSNTIGGDYWMGETLAHLQEDDGRITE